MISQTAEYALRAVVYLADTGDRPKTTQQIAEATRVPVGYLSKVLQSLSRSGIVSSTRGLGGGSVLAKPAEDLTVFEVVQAVDPLQRIHECPLGIPSHGRKLCPLHQRLDNAMAHVEKSFRESTIRELLDEPSRNRPLCGMEGKT